MFKVGNIAISRPAKYYHPKGLCSFINRVAFVKSMISPVLFSCIAREFEWRSKSPYLQTLKRSTFRQITLSVLQVDGT